MNNSKSRQDELDNDPVYVLRALEVFGFPTRNRFIDIAWQMVREGKLDESIVRQAIQKFDEEEAEKYLNKYGTRNPSLKTITDYTEALIKKFRKEDKEKGGNKIPDFVSMWELKTSNTYLYTSSLAGCISVIIFQHGMPNRGLMAHYPPTSIDELIKELKSNSSFFLSNNHPIEVILFVEEIYDNEKTSLILRYLQSIFPNPNIELKKYKQGNIGTVNFYIDEAMWSSDEHGSNSFKL